MLIYTTSTEQSLGVVHVGTQRRLIAKSSDLADRVRANGTPSGGGVTAAEVSAAQLNAWLRDAPSIQEVNPGDEAVLLPSFVAWVEEGANLDP